MEKFKAAFMRVRKAVAVVVAGAVVVLARKAGVELANEDVQTILEFAFVAAAVFVAPANVKPAVREVLEGDDGEV
jgi:hypothetical protein